MYHSISENNKSINHGGSCIFLCSSHVPFLLSCSCHIFLPGSINNGLFLIEQIANVKAQHQFNSLQYFNMCESSFQNIITLDIQHKTQVMKNYHNLKSSYSVSCQHNVSSYVMQWTLQCRSLGSIRLVKQHKYDLASGMPIYSPGGNSG